MGIVGVLVAPKFGAGVDDVVLSSFRLSQRMRKILFLNWSRLPKQHHQLQSQIWKLRR